MQGRKHWMFLGEDKQNLQAKTCKGDSKETKKALRRDSGLTLVYYY